MAIGVIAEEITNATVITNITTEGNWSPDYTGPMTGIDPNQWYFDSVNDILYHSTETNVVRWDVNTISV